MKLRNNTKKRFKKKIKNSDNCLASYIGHLKWGSCNNLLYKNIKQIDKNINSK